jgi:hypothetical protein
MASQGGMMEGRGRPRIHSQPDGPIVYLAKRKNLYKIGRTTKWRLRVVKLQDEGRWLDREWLPVHLIHVIQIDNIKECERILLARFSHALAWRKEWFELSAKEVADFCAIRGWQDICRWDLEWI